MTHEKQSLEKYFQEHALPDFHILESPSIKVNGQSYTIVGQKTLNSFLFSHFDVLDSYGEPAEKKRSKIVYTYISMYQMTEVLEQLMNLLNEPNSQTTLNSQHFEVEFKENINVLLDENDQIRTLLQRLIDEKDNMLKIQEWEEADFQNLQFAWDSFWNEYEQRLKVLFKFREHIWKHNKNVSIQETNLQNIYQEADAMYLLFAESLSTDHPLMTNIDDLITIAEEIGRVDDENENRLLTSFERFNMHFFKITYRTLLWGLFPVSVICMLLDICNFNVVYNVLIISLVFLVANSAETRGRKTKIIRRFKQGQKEKLASHQLIQTTYAESFETIKAQEESSVESSYQFVATPTVIWRSMLVVGIMMCLIGIGILDTGGEDEIYGYGWLTVGGILLLLRVLLPFTNFGNIKFGLTPDGLKRGKKKKTYLQNILEISVNKRGTIFTVDIGMRYRQKFKIRKPYRQNTKEELKIWCDKYSLNFKGRLYF